MGVWALSEKHAKKIAEEDGFIKWIEEENLLYQNDLVIFTLLKFIYYGIHKTNRDYKNIS